MELNLNDEILLVGEANFSFTISLADYCKNRSLITTTCYESLDDLKRIFGEKQIEANFSLLNSLNVNKIFFNVDATSIHENLELTKAKYSKIIFMFPHACCKKTNLKLNRKLLEGFLLSSKLLLKENGCVYVTLARGQGGSKFDVNLNPTSEQANDNWQLVQIANSCGYLLTECYKFDSNRFQYYKSTGYKIGNKSFNTEMSLVHKLELSLSFETINFCLSSELIALKCSLIEKFDFHNELKMSISSSKSWFINEYLKTSLSLFEDQNAENPLVKLKKTIINYSRDDFDVYLFEDYNDLHFSSKIRNDYCVVDGYFIRSSLNSQDLVGKLAENRLNIFSALLLDDVDEIDQELNNYKYEILLNKVLTKDTCVQENKENSLFYSVNQKNLFKINKSSNELIIELDAGYLCQLVNQLDDRRLLFSSDRRTFNSRPFLIQTVRYTHDLCFWYNRNDFDEKQFLNLIRDLSFNQIRYVILIDRNFKKVNLNYKNEFDDDENIYSAFYRFIYENYDTALSFDSARYIQDRIRDQIKIKLNLVPR